MVETELSRAGLPIPVPLVLALMDLESNGVAGAVNASSGASGLLQVMPGTLADYNAQHAVKVTLDEMRSPGDANGQKQIRVGLWVLGQFWKGAYKYLLKRLSTVPTDELAKIADLFYAAGPGATKKKLDTLTIPTFQNVAAAFPSWKAIGHANTVFKRLADIDPQPFNLDAIADWLHGALTPPKGKRPIDGFILGAIVILLALWYFKKGAKNGKENQTNNEN